MKTSNKIIFLVLLLIIIALVFFVYTKYQNKSNCEINPLLNSNQTEYINSKLLKETNLQNICNQDKNEVSCNSKEISISVKGVEILSTSSTEAALEIKNICKWKPV